MRFLSIDTAISNIFNKAADYFSELFSAFFDSVISFFLNLFGAPTLYLAAWMNEQGFSLEVPNEVFEVLDEITYTIGYIFPLYSLLPIVYLMLSFYISKIVYSVFSFVTRAMTLGLSRI